MEQAIFHLINEQWTSPALDLFMAGLSDVEIWKPLIVVIVVYALIFRGFKGRAFVLCVGLTLAISETVVVRNIKKGVSRPRPKQTQMVRLVELQPATPKVLSLFKQPRIHYSLERDRSATGGSFPSAHAVNNFVIGTFCALFFGRWGWPYFIFAALVSYSRAYLGSHWPSDIAASAFMAVGEALLMAALLEWVWRWAGPRWAANVFSRHPRLIENVAFSGGPAAAAPALPSK